MEIRSINAMRGPNYWSVRRHKLIVMVLDLQEMEELPSNKIDGFPEMGKEKNVVICKTFRNASRNLIISF